MSFEVNNPESKCPPHSHKDCAPHLWQQQALIQIHSADETVLTATASPDSDTWCWCADETILTVAQALIEIHSADETVLTVASPVCMWCCWATVKDAGLPRSGVGCHSGPAALDWCYKLNLEQHSSSLWGHISTAYNKQSLSELCDSYLHTQPLSHTYTHKCKNVFTHFSCSSLQCGVFNHLQMCSTPASWRSL